MRIHVDSCGLCYREATWIPIYYFKRESREFLWIALMGIHVDSCENSYFTQLQHI